MTNKSILFAIAATIILPFGKVFGQDKAEFKPSGKVWGYAFGDYYYKTHADSMKRGGMQYSGLKNGSSAFEFRRVYLGYDYNISEKFSTEFLLAYEGQTLSDGATRTVFIKAANIRWKNIVPRNTLVFGQSATPSYPLLTEKLWGYRSIEKTVLDMHKNGNSNDLGVSLLGTLDSAGNFGYNFMVGNGSAAKIENDIYKKFYGDIYAKFCDQKIVIDLYADIEGTQLAPYHKYKKTYKLAVAYVSEKISAGVEAFEQIQHNYVTLTTPPPNTATYTADVLPFGVACFVRGPIRKDKLSFFVRADLFDPDKNFDPENIYSTSGYSGYTAEMLTVAGLDITPVKNVHIMPNIWYSSCKSRVKGAAGRMKSDYDLVPRVTIHYIFK